MKLISGISKTLEIRNVKGYSNVQSRTVVCRGFIRTIQGVEKKNR